MKQRFMWWAILLVLLATGITAFCYPSLPARIPSHWNAAGAVDAWGPRAGIFIEPFVMLCLALLWRAMPGISPRRFEVDGFEDTWWFSGMATLGLLAFVHALLLWAATGGAIDMGRSLVGGLGVFILLVGNVMGKVRRNFWLGIRTPWTLADERVWHATHRLAGKTMVASGLLMLVIALVNLPAWTGIALLVAGTLAPAAYSLACHKRLQRAGHPDA